MTEPPSEALLRVRISKLRRQRRSARNLRPLSWWNKPVCPNTKHGLPLLCEFAVNSCSEPDSQEARTLYANVGHSAVKPEREGRWRKVQIRNTLLTSCVAGFTYTSNELINQFISSSIGTTPKDIGNRSTAGFILLGFPDQDSHLLLPIFILIYLMTLTGNATIIVLITVDTHLKTPMYYFVGQLSFLEMCYTSVTAPNMIVRLVTGHKYISFGGCMVQHYIFISLGSTETLLLAAMALDRFLAICHPLRYHAIMSRQICIWLTIGSWLVAFLFTLAPSTLMAQLPFCNSHVINHFFCDSVPLLQLACADTFVNEMLNRAFASAIVLSSLVVILLSYVNIIFTVVKIPSSIGRWRTFSTCASHLIVVLIFFGTVIFMYIGPKDRSSFTLNKALALCYTMLTPLLNPIIYSFRNKEVKQALLKVLRKRVSLRTLAC
ncbi:olfactory receptor 6C4-like [Ambystoma mexicanum]|uniref:olfactory receptor 6C4-like n=1 Tax=Ambystoma mexicanum TaxID=8296 RepID=UPI0037E81759